MNVVRKEKSHSEDLVFQLLCHRDFPKKTTAEGGEGSNTNLAGSYVNLRLKNNDSLDLELALLDSIWRDRHWHNR